ncbi:MAG: rsmB [Micavibrio sp.]|nr:rsmB [Micavibrio sp.]
MPTENPDQPDLYGESQPYPEMLHARGIALKVLDLVLTRRTPLDQVLEENTDLMELPVRDRAFVRMIVATTLRRMGQIDDLIVKASDGKPAPQPPMLHHLLRMGVAQLMFMNVPDHAAVNTAVQLAENVGLGRGKGFVNAILRRLGREGRGWLEAQDEARANVPEWLLKEWINDYGLGEAAEIAQASLAEAPLDITIKDPAKMDYWAEVLQATPLPGGSLRRISGGNVQDLPGYHDGMWWVQDASATLPARLFGDLHETEVVDLCAAPGGKTAQLAAAGASVIALDRSITRIKRLDENMRRLRLDKTVHTEAADGTVWQPRVPVPAVLLDAPCSATGTIRRHPDVLRLKRPDDIVRLCEMQSRMLDNACDMLLPGGMLIYCTCSLQKAEGERQIESFLKRNPVMKRKPIAAAEIGHLENAITPQGDVRILPWHLAAHGGMDGFYIARMVKES